MGYDLIPRNKDAGSFYLGAFSFPVLLEACGYLWPAIHKGARYYCVFGIDERMPKGSTNCQLSTNDGFRVTAEEARIMARMARNFVIIQRSLPDENAVWNNMMKPEYLSLWPLKIREDFVDKLEAFATWAESSSGFKIK